MRTTRVLTKPIAGPMAGGMDKLDQLIADKVAEIEGLAQKRQYALIELEALKRAAQARPLGAAPSAEPKAAAAKPPKTPKRTSGKYKGGRQAGDISHEWRKVLAILHGNGGRYSYPQILMVAERTGIKTQLANVRERVRTMAENGLMKGQPDNGFYVSQEAVTRFKLDEIYKQVASSAAA